MKDVEVELSQFDEDGKVGAQINGAGAASFNASNVDAYFGDARRAAWWIEDTRLGRLTVGRYESAGAITTIDLAGIGAGVLGGVMGGEATEMSATTSHVLIESAHWDAVSMFRTGKRHKITSEAGKRNERGVDPTICEAAADRVAELLVRYGGGTASRSVTVVGTPPDPAPITISSDLPARVTGMKVDADTTVAHLRAVGCDVTVEGDRLTATPPPVAL